MVRVLILISLFGIAYSSPTCELPVERGPCRARQQRFYYDKNTNTCRRFQYGGCQGNENRFLTLAQCEKACLKRVFTYSVNEQHNTRRLVDNTLACAQPKYTGPCRARKTRYYYNKNEGRCKSFIYGGCDGNENNFRTLSECQSQCDIIDICSQRADSGICYASIPKWFYDVNSDRCLQFTYGGCGGNANNFLSQNDCNDICGRAMREHMEAQSRANVNDQDTEVTEAEQNLEVCALQFEPGPCYASMEVYYYDKDHGKCRPAVYGGCHGNENRFESKMACEFKCSVQDICKLPKKVGPCKAAVKRWYFDQQTKKCVNFTYGGCQGNANSFKSKEACENSCSDSSMLQPVREKPYDICVQRHHTCKGNVTRWFYCTKMSRCMRYNTTANCHSTGGPRQAFESLAECKAACPLEEICQIGKETGPCYASMPMWYYCRHVKDCKSFTYGGCGGNPNRFPTREQCRRSCGVRIANHTLEARPRRMEKIKKQDACALPSETGPCRAAMPKYFFNTETSKCELFTFGGCEGNANRFETRDDCEVACGPQSPEIKKTRQQISANQLEQTVGRIDRCSSATDFPASRCDEEDKSNRWFYDLQTAKCEEKLMCESSARDANNFPSKASCESECSHTKICRMPKTTGPCRAYMPAWYYNQASGNCEEFIYGGCHGNANRFWKKQLCESKCGASEMRERSLAFGGSRFGVCNMKKDQGICYGSMPRWYYDTENGECKEFTYGGCMGNSNRFRTKQACEQTCSAAEICSLNNDPGLCYAYIPSYFYNTRSGKCEQFIYGGCGGNANRFQTKKACEKRCQAKDICKLQSDSGPCYASMERYYFDNISKECKTFIYGGCLGNANRFSSKPDCESVCKTEQDKEVNNKEVNNNDDDDDDACPICSSNVPGDAKFICAYKHAYKVTYSNTGDTRFPMNVSADLRPEEGPRRLHLTLGLNLPSTCDCPLLTATTDADIKLLLLVHGAYLNVDRNRPSEGSLEFTEKTKILRLSEELENEILAGHNLSMCEE